MAKPEIRSLTESLEQAGTPRHTGLDPDETPAPTSAHPGKKSGRAPMNGSDARARQRSVTVWIDNDLHKALKDYCRLAGISFSSFADEALRVTMKRKLKNFRLPELPNPDAL